MSKPGYIHFFNNDKYLRTRDDNSDQSLIISTGTFHTLVQLFSKVLWTTANTHHYNTIYMHPHNHIMSIQSFQLALKYRLQNSVSRIVLV